MGGLYILDEKGEPKPIDDVIEWSRQFETQDRRLRRTDVGKHYVSTVFLGSDHNWGDGPPLLFETMVFGPGDLFDDECERCTTRAQAIAGHETMCQLVRAHKADSPRQGSGQANITSR